MIAQIIFVVAALFGVIGVQQKKKRSILAFFATSTLMASVAFIFLEAYSGSVSLFMMSIFAVISYLFDKKNRSVPNWLMILFIIATVSLGALTVQAITDVIPIVASVCYVVAVTRKQEKYIRLFTAINLVLWVSFDAITSAYAAVLTDGAFAISTIIAIVRYDVLPKLKKRQSS